MVAIWKYPELCPKLLTVEGATAIGAGGVPFAKTKAGWDNLKKSKPQIISRGDNQQYIYVFIVPKDMNSWKLTYKESVICDLKNQ